MALVAGISLPLLHRADALALPASWCHLLSVQRVPALTTLIAGTMFQGTKLPLRTWVLALHLLTSIKTNMAALELTRHLEMNCKSAWRMKHKIMQVIADRESRRKPAGFVQIDDAYLGDERNDGEAGRGS